MLKCLCKLVNLTRSHKRKHKGLFFSEHSVFGSNYKKISCIITRLNLEVVFKRVRR